MSGRKAVGALRALHVDGTAVECETHILLQQFSSADHDLNPQAQAWNAARLPSATLLF